MLGNLWSPVSAENANQPQGTLFGGGASLAGGYSLGGSNGNMAPDQQQPFQTIYRLPQTNAAGQPQQPQQPQQDQRQLLGQANGAAPMPPSGANPPALDGTVGGNMSPAQPGPIWNDYGSGNPVQSGYAIDASGKPMPVQSGYEIDASGKPMQQPGWFNSNPQQGSLSSLGKSIPNGVQQGMQQYAPLAQMGGGFGF